MTADEQFVSFKGGCSFKAYVPYKPARYGIKIWKLSDTAKSYVLKSQVCTGRKYDKA